MVEILDCTLRDGGYQNAWNFPKDLIDDYIIAMNSLPVDYLEIGFRTPRNVLPSCANATDDFVRTLPKNQKKLCVMVNASELNPSSLEIMFPQNSLISVVRIAFHYHEILTAAPLIKQLHNKGLEIMVNIMQASLRSYSELADAAMFFSTLPISVIYIADSLGGMSPKDVSNALSALRSQWQGKIGVHAHNSRGLALANSIQALSENTIVDCTILGMGRGPGNTRTEQLLPDLFPNLNTQPLLTIMKRFAILQEKLGWGPNPIYHLAALHNIHPTYVYEMIGSGLSLSDIARILPKLNGLNQFDRNRL